MSPSRAAASKLPDAAPLFAALGDTLRLGLLGRLSADGPLSIRRLSEGTGVTRQAITRHLEALGRVGLVRDARRAAGAGARVRARCETTRNRTAVSRSRRGAVGRGGRPTQVLCGGHPLRH